jgi:hypothetical protein
MGPKMLWLLSTKNSLCVLSTKWMTSQVILDKSIKITNWNSNLVGVPITERCRLSLLTNSGVSANEYRCAHHVTWSPNILWRSTSIIYLLPRISQKSFWRCCPFKQRTGRYVHSTGWPSRLQVGFLSPPAPKHVARIYTWVAACQSGWPDQLAAHLLPAFRLVQCLCRIFSLVGELWLL